ncbi:uncharacterized protein A4U43_C09F7670 [Asparagus officinalis]|uniref:Uncharacterized protein n=1 Tax=Asparagus officinalis TaxID=4686 RepID=A0A5P1E9A4_ASPOF|nr:uncharacterized protein A4U43_C09F7670 [Asparagus officinalis]
MLRAAVGAEQTGGHARSEFGEFGSVELRLRSRGRWLDAQDGGLEAVKSGSAVKGVRRTGGTVGVRAAWVRGGGSSICGVWCGVVATGGGVPGRRSAASAWWWRGGCWRRRWRRDDGERTEGRVAVRRGGGGAVVRR